MVKTITVFCIVALFISCKKSIPQSETLSLGSKFGGGIIGYILKSGDPGYTSTQVHGLIVAENTNYAAWGCPTTYLDNTLKDFGSGQTNTTNIVNGCNESGIAARLCDDLILNGYSDWYLPSFNELLQIMANREVIGGFVSPTPYWSSSENGNQFASYAFTRSVLDDPQIYTTWQKQFIWAYRPVRSF